MMHSYALSGRSNIRRPAHQNVPTALTASTANPASTSTATSTADPASPSTPAVTPSAEELSSEERNLVTTLQAPKEGQIPLSMSSIKGAMNLMQAWLEYEDLQRASTSTYSRAMKLLRHNATVLGWYPTYTKEKLWLNKSKCSASSAHSGGTLHMPSGLDTDVVLLSRMVYVLMIDQVGIRGGSWADAITRGMGEIGRYLRWGRVLFRLLGYDEDDEPVFLAYGTASATKERQPSGDGGWQGFTFGSRRLPLAATTTPVAAAACAAQTTMAVSLFLVALTRMATACCPLATTTNACRLSPLAARPRLLEPAKPSL